MLPLTSPSTDFLTLNPLHPTPHAPLPLCPSAPLPLCPPGAFFDELDDFNAGSVGPNLWISQLHCAYRGVHAGAPSTGGHGRYAYITGVCTAMASALEGAPAAAASCFPMNGSLSCVYTNQAMAAAHGCHHVIVEPLGALVLRAAVLFALHSANGAFAGVVKQEAFHDLLADLTSSGGAFATAFPALAVPMRSALHGLCTYRAPHPRGWHTGAAMGFMAITTARAMWWWRVEHLHLAQPADLADYLALAVSGMDASDPDGGAFGGVVWRLPPAMHGMSAAQFEPQEEALRLFARAGSAFALHFLASAQRMPHALALAQAAAAHARLLVVIMSLDYLESRNCCAELRAAAGGAATAS